MPLMLTWNMQGGQGTYESKWQALAGRVQNPGQYGLAAAPDIIFLQESSDVPGACDPGWRVALPQVSGLSKNFGTFNNPHCYFVAHYAWGANSRVSYAVLIHTRAHPNTATREQWSEDLSASVVVHNPVSAAHGTRPIIGVTLGAATYYSMHAPSGVASGFSRVYVSGMISAACAMGSYVIGGDFNCEPNDLYNAMHPIPNGQLDIPGANTCGSKQYDYFTSNNSGVDHTALNTVSPTNLLSDHLGVSALY